MDTAGTTDRSSDAVAMPRRIELAGFARRLAWARQDGLEMLLARVGVSMSDRHEDEDLAATPL